MKKRQDEAFVLPSFFSIANVFFGFFSILSCFHGKYSRAASLIIAAALMDGLDGLFARATQTQSDFGAQLDSLSDVFSFGTAPSILLYFWGLHTVETPGALFCFIFLTAGILRLARYSVLQKTQPDRKYYIGLSVPSASLFFCSLILFHPLPLERVLYIAALSLMILIVSLLMVSRIKFRNFQTSDLRRRVDPKAALLLAVIVSAFVFYTKYFLITLFSGYVLSGPFFHILSRLRKKAHPTVSSGIEDSQNGK